MNALFINFAPLFWRSGEANNGRLLNIYLDRDTSAFIIESVNGNNNVAT